MIDICDFAVGLSRQLYGKSIASERPGHRLTETWHPLGPVAVISAFNFPVAVWSWNAALALVCGDPVIWKPSERTPLTAIATTSLLRRAADRFGDVPHGLFELVLGGADRAVQLAEDERIPLVSATGSTAMGKAIAPRISARLGRSLLELGGNNAAIVAPSADLDLVVRAVLFAAVGTAGQRCTSLRRLIVHESVADDLVEPPRRRVPERADRRSPRRGHAGRPARHGRGVRTDGGGSRRRRETRAARWSSEAAARTPTGGPTPGTRSRRSSACRRSPTSSAGRPSRRSSTSSPTPTSTRPSRSRTASRRASRRRSSPPTFARQSASSPRPGSDCGIANVNIGPSGAEIGGAFGGEKETGGGRESGSDAWRAYMRRQTATVNFTNDLPLAQGIRFDVDVDGAARSPTSSSGSCRRRISRPRATRSSQRARAGSATTRAARGRRSAAGRSGAGREPSPAVGEAGHDETVTEYRVETVVPDEKLEAVVAALRRAHPYEEPAYDVYLRLDP